MTLKKNFSDKFISRIILVKNPLNVNFAKQYNGIKARISIYAIFGLPQQARKPRDYCNLIGSMMVIKIKNFFILFMNMSLNLTLSVILNNGLNNMKQTDPKLIQGIKFS